MFPGAHPTRERGQKKPRWQIRKASCVRSMNVRIRAMSDACDHEIGVYEWDYDTWFLRASQVDGNGRGHPHSSGTLKDFSPHNFCPECGADVRELSAKVQAANPRRP